MASIEREVAGLQTSLRKFRHEFGIEFVERVKARTPVRTGTLRDGWEYKLQAYDVAFANPVEYASFVEYGTERMEPRGMLRATMLEVDEIVEVAAERAGLNR